MIDGCDGVGKSTQVKLLAEVMEKAGVGVLSLRDPGGTAIGEKIRQILLDNGNQEMAVRCEALLYMASRAQLYQERIKPALAEGKCVICDRWVSSTYAYQAVAGKIGTGTVLRIAEAALERTWPDLTIILDLPSEEGLKRINPLFSDVKSMETPGRGREFDRMEAKGSQFHQQVRRAFLELAQGRPDFQVVSAAGNVNEVHARICDIVSSFRF